MDRACIVCKKDTELKKGVLSLLGGKIVIDDEYYKCPHCGEKFSTSKQMNMAADQIRNKYHLERTIIETGRSLAFTLPPSFAQFYNLKKGSKVRVVPEGKDYARIVFE